MHGAARRARALPADRRAGAAATRGGLAEGGPLLQPEGTCHIRHGFGGGAWPAAGPMDGHAAAAAP
ncbi:hypothetical protein, partial [Paenibacillus alginolyticus]|uniref:hypothetical protein n=1 Tax=Paenibacillus alginolyticus TaxID=59839 RepID=UPI002DBFBA97